MRQYQTFLNSKVFRFERKLDESVGDEFTASMPKVAGAATTNAPVNSRVLLSPGTNAIDGDKTTPSTSIVRGLGAKEETYITMVKTHCPAGIEYSPAVFVIPAVLKSSSA